MTYTVTLTDTLTPQPAGRPGPRYSSPPHDHQAALILAQLLLGLNAPPVGPSPWTRAVAGGQRTVHVHGPL